MSKEEEKPARVTRGALRRMSVDQEPTSAPVTPKLTAANLKKAAALDAIREGSTGPSDIEEDSATKNIGNKSVQKIKENDFKPSHRTATLTEHNVSLLENSFEVRRTPRRRPSQDSTPTPQTVPAATRRKTRRNSATSDDGNMSTTTPKVPKSRLSVAPPTIAEDDEKEDKANSSSTAIAEAELSDLDIRKLRNRAISNSPIPRSSPSGKNTSLGSQKADEAEGDSSKVLSPTKEGLEPKSSESVVDLSSDENDEKTPTKSEGSKSTTMSQVESVKRQLKDVTFEEGTPNQLEKSVYPKTPIVPLGEKRRKLSEKLVAEVDESMSVTSEAIDETVQESPKKPHQSVASPKLKSPMKATPGTPNKSDQSLDKSIDTLLANMVEEVRENINQVDQSMSILGTPKPTGKQKSHFPRLREGTFSTPIATLVEEEEAKLNSPVSKSWSQAVTGTSSDKGIDVFSVRKQEESQRQEKETKQLNESLKRKSLENKTTVEDEQDEAEEEEEEDGDDNARKRNSFADEEAMEAEGYQSGDSLDSETREEMNAHEIDDGVSLGSKDSEVEEDEDEDESFIASDNEEFALLDGSGDDLEPEKEDGKSKGKKTHKRIIHHDDSTSDEEQSLVNVDESTASESKSPKKTPKKVESPKSPKKTPTKGTAEASSSSKTPKKTPSKIAFEEQEQSPESLNISSASSQIKSPKKTPAKSTSDTNAKSPMKTAAEDQIQKTPQKLQDRSQDKLPTPKSVKKTPLKMSLNTETKQPTSADEHSNEPSVPGKSDTSKSRKSLPAPALISADFYASSKKRHTINAHDVEKPSEQPAKVEEPLKNSNLVTNPAALALAKKNKRLSLETPHVDATSKKDKRSSLPGKLPVDTEIESPLKRKKKQNTIPETNGTALDPVEPMDVDETEEVLEETVLEKPAQSTKKKLKDMSEFDTSAILARCNEIVRSDKEKRKQGATLKQKKKDEKRRQREEEKQEENAEANESVEQQKKKKKKKKPVNYLLEELGEKKEDQVAKALQRKMAILEAKRERKKAKKAARLHQQLNKENQQEEGEKKEGIGSKFEKKTKKVKKAKKESKPIVEEESKPIVKLAVSAFAMYAAQIEELKKEQAEKKKPKRKLLKEKNLQPSATEEVQMALQSNVETKSKKNNKREKKASETAPTFDGGQKEDQAKVAAGKEDSPSKQDHLKKKGKTALDEPESSQTVQKSIKKLKEDKTKPEVAEKPSKPSKKKEKSSVSEFDGKKMSDRVDLLFAPLKSVVSTNDVELAMLKKSLSEPISKVAKKQKLSEDDSNLVTVSVVESTPPRKLKALTRLEKGFHEEPVTPDHTLLKRNHGFKEEPVTPKTIGFKVSNVLPAGQEALQQQAVLGKKKKIYSNSNRIRPEDVKEPAKGLPLPIWTRSGTFDVEEVSEAKFKNSKSTGSVEADVIPLNVNDGGQCSTDFLVKPLGNKKKEHQAAGGLSKAHRIDLATVDESVLNFKKQAIFGKNAHLREKKTKH